MAEKIIRELEEVQTSIFKINETMSVISKDLDEHHKMVEKTMQEIRSNETMSKISKGLDEHLKMVEKTMEMIKNASPAFDKLLTQIRTATTIKK